MGVKSAFTRIEAFREVLERNGFKGTKSKGVRGVSKDFWSIRFMNTSGVCVDVLRSDWIMYDENDNMLTKGVGHKHLQRHFLVKAGFR